MLVVEVVGVGAEIIKKILSYLYNRVLKPVMNKSIKLLYTYLEKGLKLYLTVDVNIVLLLNMIKSIFYYQYGEKFTIICHLWQTVYLRVKINE